MRSAYSLLGDIMQGWIWNVSDLSEIADTGFARDIHVLTHSRCIHALWIRLCSLHSSARPLRLCTRRVELDVIAHFCVAHCMYHMRLRMPCAYKRGLHRTHHYLPRRRTNRSHPDRIVEAVVVRALQLGLSHQAHRSLPSARHRGRNRIAPDWLSYS